MIVYISGPYTNGDIVTNVRKAICAGMTVMDYGHVPIIPHLSHFMQLVQYREYEDWIAMDLELLAVAQSVIRLVGYSPGAEIEVERASELKIPVHSLSEWIVWQATQGL